MLTDERKNSEFIKLKNIPYGICALKLPFEESIDPLKIEALKAIIDSGMDYAHGFDVSFNDSFTRIKKMDITLPPKQELAPHQFDINEKFNMTRPFQTIKVPIKKQGSYTQNNLTFDDH